MSRPDGPIPMFEDEGEVLEGDYLLEFPLLLENGESARSAYWWRRITGFREVMTQAQPSRRVTLVYLASRPLEFVTTDPYELVMAKLSRPWAYAEEAPDGGGFGSRPAAQA